MKLYIDVGHGGKDCGAVGVGGVKESAINLEVGKYLKAELIRQGHEVLMSRENDITEDLDARVSEANNFGSDIVISIHCNAHTTESANGTEVFILKKGGNAEKIANKVLSELVSTLGTKKRDPGVKESNFYILRKTIAPAILCELAFITNRSDKEKIDEAAEHKSVAVAICKGVCSYLGTTYKKEETKVAKTKFKDESKMSSWAIDSIKKVSDAGIMNGDTNGNFRPKDAITREEVAVIVAKLLK